MTVGWISCFTVLVLMHKDTVQSASQTVRGFIDGEVILPCSLEQNTQYVFWQNKFDASVCDISVGKDDCQEPNEDYIGRVKIFPSETKEGNFSILLQNLKKNDEGIYICNAPSKGSSQEVELKVHEKPSTTERDKRIIRTSTVSPNSESMSKRGDGLLILILGCALLYVITF